MKSNTMPSFCAILLISLFITCIPILTPEARAEKYRLIPSGLPDPQGFAYSGSLLATGPNSGLFVYKHTGVELGAWALDEAGAKGKMRTLFSQDPRFGTIKDYSLVWAGDHGVLFVLILDTIADRVTLYRTTFSADGTPQGTRRLFSTTHDGSEGSVTATRQGNRIGVVFTARTIPFMSDAGVDTHLSRAWFVSTSLTGSVLDTIREFDIDSADGLSHDVRFSKPAWNGKRWIVPGVAVVFNPLPAGSPYGYWIPAGVRLMVFAIEPGDKPHILRRIIQDGTDPTLTELVSDVRAIPLFVPDEQPAVRGRKIDLLFRTVAYDTDPSEQLESATYRWKVLTIGATGALARKPVELVLPVWKHRLGLDPGRTTNSHSETMADPVLSADGTIMLAHTRSLARRSLTAEKRYLYDAQLNVYRYDSVKRVIAGVVAEKRAPSGHGFLSTLAQPFGTGILTLNRALHQADDGSGSYVPVVRSYISLLSQ